MGGAASWPAASWVCWSPADKGAASQGGCDLPCRDGAGAALRGALTFAAVAHGAAWPVNKGSVRFTFSPRPADTCAKDNSLRPVGAASTLVLRPALCLPSAGATLCPCHDAPSVPAASSRCLEVGRPRRTFLRGLTELSDSRDAPCGDDNGPASPLMVESGCDRPPSVSCAGDPGTVFAVLAFLGIVCGAVLVFECGVLFE